MSRPEIFTVPFGQPFAMALARFVLGNYTPLEIAKLRIIVPRPRQKETLEKAFLEASGGQTIWPRISSFGIGEDLPENTLTSTERLMLLSRLVQAWNESKGTPSPPSRVLENAQALAGLFDKLTSHNIPFHKLIEAQEAGLLPAELASHWQENLNFLSIVLEAYPSWLEENNKQDPTVARAKVLENLTHHGRTIIAGFADTTPLGLKMMEKVLENAESSLILPGWPQKAPFKYTDLPEAHPCYGMANILNKLGIKADTIPPLPTVEKTEDTWLKFWDEAQTPPPTLPTVVEAPSPQTEAEAISLIMQEALHMQKTCALVTPDRTLAGRVASTLAAKGIQVDDSAGEPLHKTPLGTAFINIITVVTGQFKVMDLLPLLRNPMLNCGHTRAEWLAAVKELEEAVRGTQAPQGLRSLQAYVKENLALDALPAAFAPLTNLKSEEPLEVLITAHLETLKNLLGAEALPPSADIKKLMGVLEKWQQSASQVPVLTLSVYKGYLSTLMSAETVRLPWQQSQLFIWGPLEASLQQVDTMILGGMNEGTWPHLPAPDPWLNRPLAASLGLPPAEVPVGLAAHDFLSLISAPNVVVTRAKLTNEGETVPSRFLAKLDMAAPENNTMRQHAWLDWVQAARRTGATQKAKTPMPVPSARRSNWSASYVKTLMACPFQAYAKYTLNLKRPEPFEKEAEAKERGTLIHTCFEAFCSNKTGWSKEWDAVHKAEMVDFLISIGREKFADLNDVHKEKLWWPRFEIMATGFVDACLNAFKNGRYPAQNEAEAKLEIYGITLKAIADRVDVNQGHILVDYKTGAAPSSADMATGKEPQMPIEAFLASKGAFGSPAKAEGVEIWRVLGTGDETIQITSTKPEALEEHIIFAEEGIKRLSERFINQKQPYAPTPADRTGLKTEKHCEYCDFSALCRFKDWGQEQHD